jgi:hypothetical protein
VITISTDLRAFEGDLAIYAKLARKTMAEVVFKKGASLAWEWAQLLKTEAPRKGEIRAANLARLKAGGGILVRPRALRSARAKIGSRSGSFSDLVTRRIMRRTRKGETVVAKTTKGLNVWQIAVQRELAYRERARGFASYGARLMARMRSIADAARGADRDGRWHEQFFGGARQLLGSAASAITGKGSDASLRMMWGSTQTMLGEELLQPRHQALLQRAIRIVHDDMLDYIRDRIAKRGLPA